jgi:glycosyltransferase involved in cell wall biosynthesis
VPAREKRDGYEIVRVGLGLKSDKWLYCLWAPLYAFFSGARIAHAVMESYAGIALWIFGFLRPGTKRILTLQSGDLDSDIKQRRIPNWLWRRIHASPHLITAISGFLAERAGRLGAERVEIIPNGVDLSRIRPRRAEERVAHRLVCVARLSWEKGLEHLLAAVAEARKTIPDAHLLLVGDGPLRGELEAKAKELGIAHAVEFRGALANEEALKVVRTADVFVCPSLAEGLGIVFIEAQACGVPVIGTRVGGIPDVIEDGVTGALAPPADPNALKEAILRFMSDRDLSDACASEALNRIKKFDWQDIVRKVAASYERFYHSPEVLIAASVYPPDIGGPASQAAIFARTYAQKGRVTVVAPGVKTESVLADGVLLKRAARSSGRTAYFRTLIKAAKKADLIFAQDASSYTLLAIAAAILTRRPLVTRLGGDLLWERAADSGATKKGLVDFYDSGEFLQMPFIYRKMLGLTLKFSRRVIFPSAMLASLYEKHLRFKSKKGRIIKNAEADLFGINASRPESQALMSGRFVPLKNIIPTLEIVRSVREASNVNFNLVLIGSGPLQKEIEEWKEKNQARWFAVRPPVSRRELLQEIAKSLLVVNLSWSEVSPNIAVDSLALGVPILLTAENGLRDDLVGFATMVEPQDEKTIKNELLVLLSEAGQHEARERLKNFHWAQTEESMTQELGDEFNQVCGF